MSIDSRSSPPSIVNIISLLFLLSPPFSINLCNFRRSHDIDVVDRYSDIVISLTITTDVGGLERFIGLDDIFGDVGVLGTVGGVPILRNAIGDVAIPNVGVGEVTVLFVEIVLPNVAFRANGVGTLELFIMSFDARRQSLLSRSCSRAAQALSASPQQRLVFRRLLMLPVTRKK